MAPKEAAAHAPVYRDLVVVGGSSGGLEALTRLVSGLPNPFPAAVAVVLHSSPEYPGRLAEILSRHTSLLVSLAVHGETIEKGHIYLAPPDNHLTVGPRFFGVVRGPKDNGHRPAVDPLFFSAARAFGARTVGVVLSGTLSCGTRGLIAIKERGGLAIVQDPKDCLFEGMVGSALAHARVDRVVEAHAMGPLLGELVTTPLAAADLSATNSGEQDAQRKAYPAVTCPECNGAMEELETGGLVHFRCPVGHSFSLDALLYEQSGALEAALWASVRVLEESAEMARRVGQGSDKILAQRFQEKAAALLQHAGVLKEVLLRGDLLTPVEALEVKGRRV